MSKWPEYQCHRECPDPKCLLGTTFVDILHPPDLFFSFSGWSRFYSDKLIDALNTVFYPRSVLLLTIKYHHNCNIKCCKYALVVCKFPSPGQHDSKPHLEPDSMIDTRFFYLIYNAISSTYFYLLHEPGRQGISSQLDSTHILAFNSSTQFSTQAMCFYKSAIKGEA